MKKDTNKKIGTINRTTPIKTFSEEAVNINKEINIINKKLHMANIKLKAENTSLKNRVKTLENEISDCSECQYDNDKKLIEKAEKAVRIKKR